MLWGGKYVDGTIKGHTLSYSVLPRSRMSASLRRLPLSTFLKPTSANLKTEDGFEMSENSKILSGYEQHGGEVKPLNQLTKRKRWVCWARANRGKMFS